jgi:L-threonylcarbamoyladenylate synthase
LDIEFQLVPFRTPDWVYSPMPTIFLQSGTKPLRRLNCRLTLSKKLVKNILRLREDSFLITIVLDGTLPESIRQAAKLIREGGIVAFPTETVYGLGADATNVNALQKVFEAKGRPASDPLIVHVAGIDMLKIVVREIPTLAWELIAKFWPGPLTLILPKTEIIPDIVTSGLDTVAVRMPDDPVALSLITEAGVPLAAPSANSFGRPSSTSAAHVMADLSGKIDMLLDGGPSIIGVESTVLDVTCTPPNILRPGGISQEKLEAAVGRVSLFSNRVSDISKSPGIMKQHYAPRARVLFYQGNDKSKIVLAMKDKILELVPNRKIGVMVPSEDVAHFKLMDVILEDMGLSMDTEKIAQKLYELLRCLDKQEVDYILTFALPRQGLGLAIFDRLYKASGSQIIRID